MCLLPLTLQYARQNYVSMGSGDKAGLMALDLSVALEVGLLRTKVYIYIPLFRELLPSELTSAPTPQISV